MTMNNNWNKYAFISYQRNDAFAARMLSLRMACFHLPHDLPNEFVNSRRLTPVWRDREKLTSALFPGDDLPPELKEALDGAKYLIVFCTSNSVNESPWIEKEVEYFLKSHDLDHVIPYVPPIKDGDHKIYYVNSLQKAINAEREKRKDAKFDIININHEKEELELGIYPRLFPKLFRYEKSYIRIIAKTLELDFSCLWDEHKKFMKRVISWIIFVIMLFVFLLIYFGTTITAPITIKDVCPNDSLPKARNIILRIGDAEYPLNSLDTTVYLTDIPGKYRFRKVPIILEAAYYKPIITSVNVGKGFGNHYDLKMERDSSFAIFYGVVVNTQGEVVENADVYVGNKKTKTNENGEFRIIFDVSEQSQYKHLHIEKTNVGLNDNIYESPDSSKFILK